MKSSLAVLMACLLICGCLVAPAGAEAGDGTIADAMAQEKSTAYTLDGMIPSRYLVTCAQPGTIEEIHYTTRDYFGDGSAYTKRAFVYVPYGYSPENRYRVLVLCHGIGGSEYEWGMTDSFSRVKLIMDNLIMNGEIEPFLVVTPNGKAGDLSKPGIDTNTAYQAFYLFGQELRNDLLPYLDEHYSTYGSGQESLSASRDDRAMAGLSMGGMQTINIGLCECLDLFGYFGAFSACPTTYPAQEIARRLEAFPEERIHYFYNICGTEDNIAYASASAAARGILPCTDRLSEENYAWQEVPGGHNFGVWYLGFYNFARIFGAKR